MSGIFWTSDDNTFVDDSGRAGSLKVSDVVATSSRAGTTIKQIITPRVKAHVRGHFGCATMAGAELEDDGGVGTAGSHWEQRIYEGELMDAVAGANTPTGHAALTSLTLSLLEDSGW